MLTGNRMHKFDNQGAWYNYKSVRPLPKEENRRSVDLTKGTRWVVYEPAVTPGTTNPFLGDDCEEIANLDTTTHVTLAEEMQDKDNCGDEGHSGDSDEEIYELHDSGQHMSVQGAEDAESNSTGHRHK